MATTRCTAEACSESEQEQRLKSLGPPSTSFQTWNGPSFPLTPPQSPPDESRSPRAPGPNASSGSLSQAFGNRVSERLAVLVRSGFVSGTEEEARPSAPYPLPPNSRETQVLPQDLTTPDSHVPRDPRLIRLTGVHPFNVEPPLTGLFDQGFLTNKDLHYVRNHGAVPLVRDEDVLGWELVIDGLVERPVTITLRDMLADFEQVTYPVTLVCAGNRRKEQNVVRKSNGFSWGAAALSTALWTGVALGDLLARARPRRGARYVCFEGADRLPNGFYGTSVRLGWAMDPGRGMLVAHGMNGEPLPPDHGRPLRVVIPGQIGGRSVKWLRRITVTAAPSDNWYHIYDNRVLPTMVSPEASAHLPETWKDERYAIYDLNTNSAICYPAHNETVPLLGSGPGDGPGDGPDATYTLRGYAYAGGGKRVTRLEVTLDQGRTWMLANISYPEDRYREARDGEMLFGGRLDVSWRDSCFCWCFWDLEVATADLARADDFAIRAMDDAMMAQPRDMYWSVLGMMTNPWFRVIIHKEGSRLRFEHPTDITGRSEGWMERVKREGGGLANGWWEQQRSTTPLRDEARDGPKASKSKPAQEEEEEEETCNSMVNKEIRREIRLAELRKKKEEKQAWFVVDGQVYDGTSYLTSHPGGAASILAATGQNVTGEFMAIHSENARAMMRSHHIGSLDARSQVLLDASRGSDAQSTSTDETSPPRPTFLDPTAWTKARLRDKVNVSSDSRLFTFELEHDDQLLGLPVGHHLLVRLPTTSGGKASQLVRAYTPISDQKGWVRLLIKIYGHEERSSGRAPGRMTQALDRLAPGQTIEMRGPFGRFEYRGEGRCVLSAPTTAAHERGAATSIEGAKSDAAQAKQRQEQVQQQQQHRQRHVRRLVMICAGSGVAPMLQVLDAVARDPQDTTECTVLDGNRTAADILCREQLAEMAAADEKRYRVVHALSQPGPGWDGFGGRMDRGFLEREAGRAPEKGEALVLMCGPEEFEKSVCENMRALGWGEGDIITF